MTRKCEYSEIEWRLRYTAMETLSGCESLLCNQGRCHDFESGGTNSASKTSRKFFRPPTFWPVGGQNIA